MQSSIPQVSPKASYEAQQAQIDEAVLRVLKSGWYLQGAEVKAFEAEFAHWNSLYDAVGVGNGTDALEVAMRALDIGNGHEVIAPTHTATATVAAIELVGATPVLVDIERHTYTLSPEAVQRAITPHTRAIIAVHLYGQPADITALQTIATANGIKLVEDVAQATGARYHDKRVGSMGDIAAYSFYPTKNLSALGDGGAVGCVSEEQSRRVRAIAQYGWRERYISDEQGMNTRLDEIQAAILRCKLAVLDSDNQRRNDIAQRYTKALKDKVIVPSVRENCTHVYHLYVVRHPRRDELRQYLNEQGVGTGIHYPRPVHLQPAYQGRLGDVGSFPITEQFVNEIVSLPLFPELTDEQVDRVIEAVLLFKD